MEREFYSVLEIQHQSKIMRSASESFLAGAETEATGRRDAAKVEAVGAKT